MKLIHFVVGPFRWQRIGEKWNFEFRPATLLSFPCGTAVVPSDLNNFRRRKIVQVAAGPVASVVTGLLAAAAVFTAPGHAWAGDWRVLSYFATISLVVGLLNFIPFKMGTGYSDGAKLFQLRSEGLWASYHRLLGLISSTKVTQNRPRDYDIETVERAAGTIARGVDELNMHLCAYAFYLDKGQLEQAREALARAERLCQESSIEVPEDRYAEFVFAIAFLRRDAAAARRWWERMVARDSFEFDDRLWNSRCALLLSENRLQEALEVWKKADAWARQLPKAGAWDAQRHAVQLLGRALRESLATAAVPAV
jgi:tetratricopeptide (TPR) repeat protein